MKKHFDFQNFSFLKNSYEPFRRKSFYLSSTFFPSLCCPGGTARHLRSVIQNLKVLKTLENIACKAKAHETYSQNSLESKISTSKKLNIFPAEYSLETFQRSNQDTSLTHKPAVFEGTWVQSGDLLTDCASSVGGELSLGQNLLIAYMPWEGYNFEDAILISERLVRDDLYTSVHIERYDIETYETKLGVEQITRDIPDISMKEIEHLDHFGIVKMGAWVEEGDILVGKVTPINKKAISPYQKLLYTILDKQIRPIRDSSLRAPKGIKAKVIDIKYFLRQNLTNFKASMPLPIPEGNRLNKTQNSQITEKKIGVRKLTSVYKENQKTRPNLSVQRKNENIIFLKKINKLFYKKMYKKQKLNLLRFYLFTRFDLKKIFSRITHEPTISINGKGLGFEGSKNSSKKTQSLKISPIGFAVTLSPQVLRSKTKGPKGYRQSQIKNLENLFKSTNMNRYSSKIQKSLSNTHKQYSTFSLFNGPIAFANRQGQNTDKNLILRNIEIIHIYLAEKRKIQVGDKMAGRHGNKGIVSQILPITDMPYLPDGTPLDMVLNPLGVPSRMNVGQIYECLLGLAGKFLGENYKVFSFDEIYGPEASRSFVFNKLYQARSQTGLKWLFDPNSPGKMRLYDGRTGNSFDQKVTVGQAYILRLVHMVDDKIHMRSTGPYSLVTQQPLRGRSKQGGQRLGEMEVWAIEGYGAAFTLLEMLTIKSDDMTGRMTLWSNLILNKDISIGTPESFKVLICELQALCLDIGLFRYMDDSNTNQKSLREITSLVNLP